jgi:N-acetylglucosaminyldiphosphoundecaprenol N-acetyl-beta-D-mannosaminyltransferase
MPLEKRRHRSSHPLGLQHMFSDRGRPAVGTVVILVAGGLEHGGGIGRQMGYFLRSRRADDGLAYRVVDPRGPWFLGDSPLRTGLAAGYLASAMARLAAARLRSERCLAHINIAGRGSTLRKAVLAGFARGIGLPYLLHVHEPSYADWFGRQHRLVKRVVAAIFRGADKVLVLGSRERDALAPRLDLPPDRLAVMPNAVPDPQPEGAARKRREGPCRLLFLGDLSARKGVPELLRALSRPRLGMRQWRATLAGGGAVDASRRLAADLGIADRVEFSGWLGEPQVRALCADADALVLPSHAEGMAMSVLEGLSYGLPVVTTPVGAHPDAIDPEVSGLFVPPGDVEALADALVRVIDEPELRRRLGAAARRRYLERFDVRGYAERLSALHASLLQDQGEEIGVVAAGARTHLADDGNDPVSAAPDRRHRVNMLGVGIDPVDLDRAIAGLDRWRAESRRDYMCCVSVHSLVTAQRDDEIRRALNCAGLAVEDGMPLVWWCRGAGFAQAGRVAGTDFLDGMCAFSAGRGHRHYFYGGSSPRVVEQLVARLTERYPGLVVAGYRSPPFRPLSAAEDAADVAAINEARPDYVWVGLGMPKQERWMASHVGRIDAAALIGVGAAFDFRAGVKPRAPLWMQRRGLEWVFRLASEPRRLARRYLVDNTIFVALTVRQLAGLKSYPQAW